MSLRYIQPELKEITEFQKFSLVLSCFVAVPPPIMGQQFDNISQEKSMHVIMYVME